MGKLLDFKSRKNLLFIGDKKAIKKLKVDLMIYRNRLTGKGIY